MDCDNKDAAFGVANFDVDSATVNANRMSVNITMIYANSSPICMVGYITEPGPNVFNLKADATQGRLEIYLYNAAGQPVNWQNAANLESVHTLCFGPMFGQ